MAGAIWDALGRALMAGGQTYGRLSELERERAQQEQERQDRLRQQAIANEHWDKSHKLQQDQFAESQKEREQRILQAAIERASPESDLTSIAGRAQNLMPELWAAMTKKVTGTPEITGKAGLGEVTPDNPLGLSTDNPVTVKEQFLRKPTLQESHAISDQQHQEGERKRISDFRTHLSSPEHAQESYDTQSQEVLANLGQSMPLTSKEWERREGVETQNQMRINNARPRAAGTGSSVPPSMRWLQGYNTIEDNVRAQYSAELSAFARAAAEGEEGAAERLSQLQKQIKTEALQMATQMLGPMPQQGPPAGGVGALDPGTESADPVASFFAANADRIAADPQGVMNEVRNAQAIPLEVKKAILAKLMTQAAPKQVAPAQSPRGAGGNPNMGVDLWNWIMSLRQPQNPQTPAGSVPRRGRDW